MSEIGMFQQFVVAARGSHAGVMSHTEVQRHFW
jgi:hypothetical protein